MRPCSRRRHFTHHQLSRASAMLRLIVFELLRLYKKPAINHLGDYCANCLVVISLFTLIATNYVYQQGEQQYTSPLLMVSTALLTLALCIKIVLLYFKKPNVKKNDDLINIMIETMPLVIRALPIGLLTLAIWSACKELKEQYLRELRKPPKG